MTNQTLKILKPASKKCVAEDLCCLGAGYMVKDIDHGNYSTGGSRGPQSLLDINNGDTIEGASLGSSVQMEKLQLASSISCWCLECLRWAIGQRNAISW